jgi:TonB family protein
LSNLPQNQAPGSQQQASRSTSPTLVNPAQSYGERKAREDYLWAVVRKISQYRYYPKSARDNSEEGMVEARLTIARDGRLLDVSVAKSSGYPNLDSAMVDIIRQASPYPPLPSDIRGDRHVFTLPLNYRRNDPH